MRAVVWERHGPAADVLKVHTDWPPPERKPGQVLVRAAATSFNAGEWCVGLGASLLREPRCEGVGLRPPAGQQIAAGPPGARALPPALRCGRAKIQSLSW